MIKTLVLGALLALPTFAAAGTTGLTWKWEGVTRRYVINSQTQISGNFWLRAQDNLDRRIDEWQLNLVTTCKGIAPSGKKAYEVRCVIDDLALAVRPLPKDKDKVDRIVEEYDQKITGSTMVIRFGYDGRLMELDLQDVKHSRANDRTRQEQEIMRLMLIRGFAGLEVQLPKHGDDQGKSWPLKDPQLMGFPSKTGTAGGLAATGMVAEVADGVAKIEAGGTGTRGPSIVDSRGAFVNLWDMKMFAVSSFDTKEGGLVSAEMMSEGKITPSSKLASGAAIAPYVQAIRVEQVGLDEELPALPDNAVLDRQ